MRRLRAWTFGALFAAQALQADTNPAPSQAPGVVSPPFVGASLNAPFPDAVYGADHSGSSLAFSTPFSSRFGSTDHSRGVISYACSPFTPRSSEGVYGIDVWLEQEDVSGNWGPASLRGGIADQGGPYLPVNTPNPGPSPAYVLTWTFDSTPLPPSTNFRVFVYVYLYNQGGGSQGNFYVASSLGMVNSGPANDAPRITWTSPFGSTNPSQVQTGQSYVISADAQDDNGNLAAVRIDKNGQPFAYAGGGDGFSGNSQNSSSDPPGTATYTAWALDSLGASSATLTWSVVTAGKTDQPPVASANATLTYGQSFTPAFSGGSGSGGWQFTIVGYTNWDAGTSANAGTWNPGGAWTPTWPPPAVGSYSFWVIRDGDSLTNPSAASGPYLLQVTPISTAFFGLPLAFTYTGSSQGPAVLPAPGSAPYQLSGTSSAVAAGNYSFVAQATGNYAGSSTINWIINPATQPSVTISPSQSTLTAGQSLTLTAGGGAGSGDFVWSGAASGSGPTTTATFPTAGIYSITLNRAGDYNYLSSAPATATVSVQAEPGSPTALLSANPASGPAPLTTTLVWSTTQATSASLLGSGFSTGLLSGSHAVTLSSPGSYPYLLSASGPGGNASRSVTVTVTTPQYTLTTSVSGSGSVSPGGTYAANTQVQVSATPNLGTRFIGWTGSVSSSANPLQVTMTGNMSLTANFSSRLPQTISFSPPQVASVPGPAVALSASATSGLPVTLSLLSGPASLAGNTVSFSGTGAVVIQASQAGNSLWLPAPSVTGTINAESLSTVFRIRFDTTGHSLQVMPTTSSQGSSYLWTDPSSLATSPWPSFANPQAAVAGPSNTYLSPAPTAVAGPPP